jgi:23S rRNA G2445 N2-methylase RlmL
MLHLFNFACALALAPPPCRYYATCVGGVEPILAAELKAARIGASDVTEGRLGVAFTGSAEVGARAVLWSRTALKIMELLSVSEGVHRAEDLYEATREAAEWSDLVGGPGRSRWPAAACRASTSRRRESSWP